MTDITDPWSGIEVKAQLGHLNARRVDSSHPHDFFWARDSKGQRLLVFQAANLHTERSLPQLRGVAVDIVGDDLTLRLLESQEFPIFTTLCLSLVERTRAASSTEAAIELIIQHLERWQRFLEKRSNELLSDQEIRGLICELTFLHSELIPRFGQTAINFWRGPAGDPQDFSVGNTLFEIKSHAAGSAPVLMISSANQLWHSAGDLFLVSYTIGTSGHETSGAVSLAGLVETIRTLFDQAEFLQKYEERLIEVGYFEHVEYQKRFFTTSYPDFFAVRDGFPRITTDSLPLGVCRIKYGIEIAACLPYRAVPDWKAMGESDGQ